MKTKPTKKRPKNKTTTDPKKARWTGWSRPTRKRVTAKRRAPSLPKFPWSASTMHHVIVFRTGGEGLGLFVSSDGVDFFAAAVAVDGKDVESVQAILDRHKHHLIGEFKTLAKAIAAAESYGLRWNRRQLAEGEDCTCVDIESAPITLVGDVDDPSPPGSSMANPLFADAKTPQREISRARVVVECETNIITKNSFGATGCPYVRPSVRTAPIAGGR